MRDLRRPGVDTRIMLGLQRDRLRCHVLAVLRKRKDYLRNLQRIGVVGIGVDFRALFAYLYHKPSKANDSN